MIIGIIGKKQSGKDTIASIINQVRPEFVIKRFADKLKEITSILTNVPIRKLEDNEFKEKEIVPEYLWGFIPEDGPKTYRKFLQYFGTEVMRSKSPNIWIDILFASNKLFDLVIPDVRYPNEAHEIKSRGGILIKVQRGPIGVIKDSHISENLIDTLPYDYFIQNDSTLDDLKLKVLNILSKILK